MRLFIALSLVLLCIPLRAADTREDAAPPSGILVFLGKVTGIEQLGSDPFKPFVVTTSVDKVLDGHFPGKRFQFSVHSPSQSGLRIGQRYTIRAVWTTEGYNVDESQWRPR